MTLLRTPTQSSTPPSALTTESYTLKSTSFPGRESSMEGRDIQFLNLPRGSSEPHSAVNRISLGERMDAPRIGHSDLQLPNFSDFHSQATHYRVPLHPYWEPWPLMTEPTVLPPEQIPEASVQMALAPGMSDDNWGDEFRAFVDDQIRANGSTPGQPITDREDSLRGTNSSLDQGNGNDVQLRNHNIFSTASHRSHGQSSYVSPQQMEDLPDTHRYEQRLGQGVEAPEFGKFRGTPKIEIVQRSKDRSSANVLAEGGMSWTSEQLFVTRADVIGGVGRRSLGIIPYSNY
ncbi:hypothetical protein DFH94DRAFT_815352 [Russula ochroleuca]|uniref:Uncharacterized protein n=1 Tax=Russula ochroleuca TaxID=152965 RepID=A0A9P5N315_9AGAM|nr:hypothetical protein DFH94DRAFT_815352 [Russula ochroleuca]